MMGDAINAIPYDMIRILYRGRKLKALAASSVAVSLNRMTKCGHGHLAVGTEAPRH